MNKGKILFSTESSAFIKKPKKFQADVEKFQSRIREKEVKARMMQAPYKKADHYDPFLATMIDIIDKGVMEQGNDSYMDQLQTLAVYCRRPNYIFGDKRPWKAKENESTDDDFCPNKFEKFEQKMKDFYPDYNCYINEILLCKHYLTRGSTELDREKTLTKISMDDFDNTKEEITRIYRSYYFTLVANGFEGLNSIENVKIDESLLANCYEKEWLLPWAHVLLLRDAQYQFMGRKKYKKSALIAQDSVFIEEVMKDKVYDKEKFYSSTYEYALRIRSALVAPLKKNYKINAALTYAESVIKKEKENQEKQDAIFPLPGIIGDFAHMEKEISQRNFLSESRKHILPVPLCDCEMIALKIANAFDFDMEQTAQLSAELPNILWDRVSVDTALGFLNAQSDTTKDVIQVVTAIRSFMNPYIYYSQETDGKDNLPQPLKDASRILTSKEVIEVKENDTTLRTWKAFSAIAEFVDLTRSALMLSHAYYPNLQSVSFMPNFIGKTLKHLQKKLGVYTENESIRHYMGDDLEHKSNEGKERYKTDDRYSEVENKINSSMNWDKARKFLTDAVLSTGQKCNSDKQKAYIQSKYKEYLYDFKKTERDDLLYQMLFKYLLKAALRCLESEIVFIFYTLSCKCQVSDN